MKSKLIHLFVSLVLCCSLTGAPPYLTMIGKSRTSLAATPASSGTTFITGQTLGTLRNDFTGGAGMQLVIGGVNVVVSQLGRWTVSGNSQTHVLRIRDNTGADIGNVTVNTSGATPAAYLFGTLGSPVTLTAGGTYYILSDETSGGDQFYDFDTAVTSTAVSAVSTGYYDGSVHTSGGDHVVFGPGNLKYTSP